MPRLAPAERSPQAWLQDAQKLLDEPGKLGRSSARSAAFLGRIALESALRRWLDTHAPGARAATFTVQLLCLQHFATDKELASRVAWTWEALSKATHHQGYELPPPRADLVRWFGVVERFAEAKSASNR